VPQPLLADRVALLAADGIHGGDWMRWGTYGWIDWKWMGRGAAANLIQLFVFLLVAHFQPFSRGTIATLKAGYQPSGKPLGIGWEMNYPFLAPGVTYGVKSKGV
jgi:hypothetical protein